MDTLAAGFWGAFFGAAALMLAASLAAFARSLQRVALMAALSAAVSALFAVAHLGWLPLEGPGSQARLLAHIAVGSAVTLGLMLMSMLGLLKRRETSRVAYPVLFGLGGAVVAVGWAMEPSASLALGSSMAFGVGGVMLVVALRSAVRGDRLAWGAVLGVVCMLIAVAGLSWIALTQESRWPVHAAAATAGVVYLATMASALWTRYSYLLELSEVMAHGPSYDPVTRMRSHIETGQMLGDVFLKRAGADQTVGVIAVTLANLYALENLHGRAAFNHALFLCASRLRRSAPASAEMGRLGEDGFLVLLRNEADLQRLVPLARQIKDRLARPVVLSTSREVAQLDAGRTAWVAEVGVGVLATSTQVRPSQAVATARAMSRTAWTFPSRMAWYDPNAQRIAELPAG